MDETDHQRRAKRLAQTYERRRARNAAYNRCRRTADLIEGVEAQLTVAEGAKKAALETRLETLRKRSKKARFDFISNS